MAAIGSDSNGRKRILFVASDGKRKTIRLGQATAKQAGAFKLKIESLITASITGSMDDETARWLAELPDKLHERIATVGLAKPRNRTAATLKASLTDYFASLNVKPATETAYDHTRRYLIEFFGENRPVRSIEPVDADKWCQHLKASKLSDATISRRVVAARQMFKRAMK
jgi:hypothetical protein